MAWAGREGAAADRLGGIVVWHMPKGESIRPKGYTRKF